MTRGGVASARDWEGVAGSKYNSRNILATRAEQDDIMLVHAWNKSMQHLSQNSVLGWVASGMPLVLNLEKC